MPKSECLCRKARCDDAVPAIAQLIHQTDSYIYPTIVSDPSNIEWIRLIGESLDCPGELFCREHLYVAEIRGKIAGLACVIPGGAELTFCGKTVCAPKLQKGVQMANTGYFQPLLEENRSCIGFNIVNFCVDAEYRGQGIGKLLMQHLITELGAHDLYLDVIADNVPAIKVYQRYGFETVSEYFGFSGSEAKLLCLHMRRPGQ